jgi:hypothetical protein
MTQLPGVSLGSCFHAGMAEYAANEALYQKMIFSVANVTEKQEHL